LAEDTDKFWMLLARAGGIAAKHPLDRVEDDVSRYTWYNHWLHAKGKCSDVVFRGNHLVFSFVLLMVNT